MCHIYWSTRKLEEGDMGYPQMGRMVRAWGWCVYGQRGWRDTFREQPEGVWLVGRKRGGSSWYQRGTGYHIIQSIVRCGKTWLFLWVRCDVIEEALAEGINPVRFNKITVAGVWKPESAWQGRDADKERAAALQRRNDGAWARMVAGEQWQEEDSLFRLYLEPNRTCWSARCRCQKC